MSHRSKIVNYLSCLFSSALLIDGCAGATWGLLLAVDWLWAAPGAPTIVQTTVPTRTGSEAVPQAPSVDVVLATLREATVAGDGATALSAARTIAQFVPGLRKDFIKHAEAFSMRGDHATAAGLLSLVPDDSQGTHRWLTLAQRAFKDGALDTATQACERVIALDPNKASAHYMLAHVHERAGRRAAALAHARRACQLAPDNRLFSNKLERLQRKP
jgi:Flp pilus assembly protein TadD